MNFVRITTDRGDLYLNLSAIARALFFEDDQGRLVAQVRFLDTEGSPHQATVTPAGGGATETLYGRPAEQLRGALDAALEQRERPRSL